MFFFFCFFWQTRVRPTQPSPRKRPISRSTTLDRFFIAVPRWEELSTWFQGWFLVASCFSCERRWVKTLICLYLFIYVYNIYAVLFLVDLYLDRIHIHIYIYIEYIFTGGFWLIMLQYCGWNPRLFHMDNSMVHVMGTKMFNLSVL